jgi:molybdopterin-containing oxidoreductase family membrane subunit
MREKRDTDYERLERTVLNPLTGNSRAYYAFILSLLAIVVWGIYAYIIQLRSGLLVTGMNDGVMWGIYLVNFVFFIGISHAGTLISAILRVTNAGWRTPITRMAELITVVAISIGALMPIIDVGRPERLWHVIVYGRFQSAIMWDIMAIICYLTGSLIYLYLPLIPDFALMRDRLKQGNSNFKYKLYTLLSLGWRNTSEQRQRLERAIRVMAILIIPIAISVHSVVAFIFSMNLRPGWDSTIFGIYFVIGAIFSGIATILIAMAIFRKIFHLEEYINGKHFRYLSYLLLTMLMLYLYLTVSEYLTVGYKLEVEEKQLLDILMFGNNAPWFWLFVVGGMLIPAFLIILKRWPVIPRIVVAAILVNIGMWFKRFVIIIPTLEVPLMPYEFGVYNPTWVEWSITAGALAAFILVFSILVKLMPIISIWEVAEEVEPHPSAPLVELGKRS